jgi:hypothetical protein
MTDDLDKFHTRNLQSDPEYAVARELLDLGEALMRLRTAMGLTRAQLGKLLRVRAADIAVLEEETPRVTAALLEESVRLLTQRIATHQKPRGTDVADSLKVIRHLRPALQTS